MYVVSLGGGLNQLQYIREIQKRGFKTIVVDRNTECVGRRYSDVFINKSVSKEEEIYEEISKYEVVGVISEQSDSALLSVAYLNSRFGLRGLKYREGQIVRDKYLQREKLQKRGVLQPSYILATNYKDENYIKFRNKFELIKKPRVGQSSTGVKILDDKNEDGINNTYIIEEYIRGNDVSVDGYINEKIFFTAYALKIKYKNTFVDKFLLVNNNVPSDLGITVKEIIQEFGVRDVFFHMEFIEKEGFYYLIELTFRGGGSGLSTKIASYVSEINTIETRVNLMLNEQVQSPACNNNKLAIMAFGRKNELEKYKTLLVKIDKNIKQEIVILNKEINQIANKIPQSGVEREACAYFYLEQKNPKNLYDLLNEVQG